MDYSQCIHQVQVEEKPKEGVGGLPKEANTNTNSTNDNISYIIANHNDRAQKVAKILEESYNNGFIMILHDINSKKPSWMGMTASTYKADLQTLLNEYMKNPDGYGYGVMIGEQLDGKFYLVAIDVDIDTEECKERISREIETRLMAYGIHYYKEITKSNRIHYYILLDKAPKEIENISKLPYPQPCFKYKDSKEIPGEIELFTKKNRFVIVYDGNYNDKEPFTTTPYPVICDYLGFVYFVKDWIKVFSPKPDEKKEPVNEPEIEDASTLFSKIVEAYKIIRNYRIINGWEIDKVFSAYCIREKITREQAIEGFKAIYESEYNENTTIRLLDNTKKKDLKLLPNLGSVYYHISLALDSDCLNDYEKEVLGTVLDDLKNLGYSNYQMPDYLKNAENIFLHKSSLQVSKDNKPYYKESYFIEQNLDGIKKVVYVSIITSEYKGIYKPHKLEHEKNVGIKAEVIRGIKEGKFEDYEYLLNDKIIYKPTFNFFKVDDLVYEIGLISMKYSKFFDISLYKQYLDIKTAKYIKENNNPPPCIINKNTGWSDDLRFFYHPSLNDNYHELHSDHVLYKLNRDLVIEKDKQHELVKAILQEGKLLAVLLTASVSSLLLKPFKIPGITYVLSGTGGAGKTTSSLIATSLFYYSDDLLMDAYTSKTGLELMIASLNSLPVLIDESALAGTNYTLQDLIFMVSSGKGKTRGRKDLTLDFKHLKSNVFWTTETTDIDELRRTGAFRRMLYIVAGSWNEFTSLFEAKDKINEKYAGCGVDYIQYLIDHMEEVEEAFNEQTKRLNTEYTDIAIIALNIYAGLILLEAFYRTKFNELRKTINKLLNEAKARFIDSRDNVVIQVMDYLESIAYQKFHVIDKNNEDEIEIQTSRNEVYGEYDKINGTYYITGKGIKEIADKLGKNRFLLLNELEKAGVLIGRNVPYYTRATRQTIKVYKLKFSEMIEPTSMETRAVETEEKTSYEEMDIIKQEKEQGLELNIEELDIPF
jgi:uncharacterized protein (DUF927 family)